MSGALRSWRRGGSSAPRRKPIFAMSFRLLLLSEVIFDGYEDYHYGRSGHLNGDLDELDQEL